MKKKFIKKEKGFTLVETLVAIFILVLSTTAPMVVAQNGLRAAYLSRDQITAFYLAQDTMEYVKNVKDHKGLEILFGTGSKDSWLDELSDCVVNSGANSYDGCTIDTLNKAIKICSATSPTNDGCMSTDANNDIPLKYDSSDLSYGFTGEDTKFARVVRIEEIQTPTEIKVTTKVRWKSHEGIGTREIEVVEYMTNWVGTLGDPD